jgi:cell division transport system permease protein
MAQAGRQSGKKGKTSYVYAIIGMSLVLFMFGIIGWFILNLRKTGDHLKENIQVHTYLYREASKKRIDSLVDYIKSFPYTNKVEYVNKSKAVQVYNAENDTTWMQFLDNNPLPESVEFYLKADHVNEDSLNVLSSQLQSAFPGVISEFQFPTATIAKVSTYVRVVGIVFMIMAGLLTILVVFSIDNTIRLAMYSNRFLIKTMQMVGATRNFISRPIIKRAIINGLLASFFSIIAILCTITLLEGFLPYFKVLHDNGTLALLFLVITTLGILISVASTYRSVIKYLKMTLDDLY